MRVRTLAIAVLLSASNAYAISDNDIVVKLYHTDANGNPTDQVVTNQLLTEFSKPVCDCNRPYVLQVSIAAAQNAGSLTGHVELWAGTMCDNAMDTSRTQRCK